MRRAPVSCSFQDTSHQSSGISLQIRSTSISSKVANCPQFFQTVSISNTLKRLCLTGAWLCSSQALAIRPKGKQASRKASCGIYWPCLVNGDWPFQTVRVKSVLFFVALLMLFVYSIKANNNIIINTIIIIII